MGLSIGVIVLASSIVFFAGIAQGLTGFGFALVAAPALLLMLPPRSVVALNLLLGAFIGVVLAVQSSRHINISRVAFLFVASIPGSLMGLYLVQMVDASVLKVFISSAVAATAIPLYLGYSRSFKQEKVSFAASGLISGVLSTTTSLSGPPVVLLLVNQGWGKEALRATVSTYLLVSSAVGIGLLATVGAYGEGVLSMGMGLVPATLLGYLVGVKLLPKMRGETFRKIVTLVVVVAGLSAAVSGLWEVIASRLAS